jgi:hypothetical protein
MGVEIAQEQEVGLALPLSRTFLKPIARPNLVVPDSEPHGIGAAPGMQEQEAIVGTFDTQRQQGAQTEHAVAALELEPVGE